MSAIFTVVARTSSGWRSPPTIPAMTLEEASSRCRDLCNRYPNQEFDILGVVAKSTRTSNVSLEILPPADFEPKRVKEVPMVHEGHGPNVMPLRGNG